MCKINGKKLGELRTEAGLTQEKLAKEVGLSRTSISNYEKGVCEPSNEVVSRICLVLDIKKDEIEIHDVEYDFLTQESKTVASTRKAKGFVRYSTPKETEVFISEKRTLSDEEKKFFEIETGQ